jgi:hypothetical protein
MVIDPARRTNVERKKEKKEEQTTTRKQLQKKKKKGKEEEEKRRRGNQRKKQEGELNRVSINKTQYTCTTTHATSRELSDPHTMTTMTKTTDAFGVDSRQR